MLIRTPADLTGYLKAVTTVHNRVRQVITGEHSRVESSTGATAQYPMVEIETPTVTIPRSQGPVSMTTRVYVTMSTPEDDTGSEDYNTDEAYRIASDIIAAMKYHSDEGTIDVSLSDRNFELSPIVAMGSDQVRGWGFSMTVEVDQSLCKDNVLDPATVFVPQFSWTNTEPNPLGAYIMLTDLSLPTPGAVQTWWYGESLLDELYELDMSKDNPIELGIIQDVDDTYRTIDIWLRMVAGGVTLWAYARVDTRYSSGRSVPFIPSNRYPI